MGIRQDGQAEMMPLESRTWIGAKTARLGWAVQAIETSTVEGVSPRQPSATGEWVTA